jgi:hypothetical protein
MKKVTAADIVYSSTDLVHFGLLSSMQPSPLASTPAPAIPITEYTSQLLAKAIGFEDSISNVFIESTKKEEGEEQEQDDGDESQAELDLDNLEEVKEDGDYEDEEEESAQQMSSSSSESAAEAGSYSI